MNCDSALRRRFRGCLLGGAVGDALGAPVEFMSAEAIHARFGPAGITDYAPAFGRLGAITDDTQMTLFTAEGLLRAYLRGATRGIVSIQSVVTGAYLRWLRTQEGPPSSVPEASQGDGWLMGCPELFSRRAPGNTCLTALREIRATRRAAVNSSKGCGGVMRVAPVGMVFANDPYSDTARIFDIGCELAAITHGHPTGYLSAGVLSVLVAMIMRGESLSAAVSCARTSLIARSDHEETLRAIEHAVTLANAGAASTAAVEQLGEGWVAEEALAIGLYCALAAKDLESGIVLSVNHGGDSDSTGSIAGNLLGAMYGVDAIPRRWIEPLELRGVIEDIADDLATHREWAVSEYGDNRDWDRLARRYPPV